MTTHALRRPALLLALLAAMLAPPIAAQEPTPAPIALSDPDGQELVIEELSIRAAVQGVFSLTEMEIVFRNPHGRRMEGRFSAVLPEGATVSRFAKEVNGRLMEGEVVERLRANRVYAEILHQMRDPALLEQDQGNRFSARIFPIEANARVRVVLGYTRLLRMESGVRTFRLPLRGLPRVGVAR
ncbi:MAG TPA: VIT domain-containing protein, partial [Longimicrobium sp.]|nr:VIT domain-containing protein [Longimicrobium sp.]